MKVFGFLTVAMAEQVQPEKQWNGVAVANSQPGSATGRSSSAKPMTNFCGMTFTGSSLVNRTCSVEADNIAGMYAGNGAFISDSNKITGFDDVTGDLDLVIFFEQDCGDSGCDNTTCWDATVDCNDNEGQQATQGVFFMETVNDGRISNGVQPTYNLQLYGVNQGDVLSIDLQDWQAANVTSPSGEIYIEGDFNSKFTVQVDEDFNGLLFQLSVTGANMDKRPLNLFHASVTN